MPRCESPTAEHTHEFENVDPGNPRCIEQLLELTTGLAWQRFGGRSDAEELVNDAVSLAWEFSQRGKGTPFTVAMFAIRRAATGGQFSRSVRSIDHRQSHVARARREFLGERPTNGWSPADIAAFRLDFKQWWIALTSRQQEVVSRLAVNYNTVETAASLGCSRGNISGIRRTLAKKYDAFIDH